MVINYKRTIIIVTNNKGYKMKYKKRSDNIDIDFQYYVSKENLFQIAFFGHSANSKQRNKLNYIWNRLLKQHKRV